MNWDDLAKQQKELEMAFVGLRKIFDEAEKKFKEKQQAIITMISQNQAQEAQNLGQIHSALDKILKSSDLGQK